MSIEEIHSFEYASAEQPWWNAYLVDPVMRLSGDVREGMRVLDVGCGNGHIAGLFVGKGCAVVGIDPSESGIAAAREAIPNGRFEIELATEGLRERLGEEAFDLVVSAEVVEHIYDPDRWAKACYEALKPGGRLVLTTPYHGYLKNLLIALMDKWDHHHTSLETHQHIKFWSRKTMTTLLERNGFRVTGFAGAGRRAYLWKSMVMSAERPA